MNTSHRHEAILTVAALLHEIGMYVSDRGYHKHSMYLIRHGDLKSFLPEEIEIVANIARYHRKSPPRARQRVRASS